MCLCYRHQRAVRSSYRERGGKRRQRDAGGEDCGAAHSPHYEATLMRKKTDQARASRGCRTSPAPAARGPRSSLRWCRCGRWSGTAATPTPAPSAAPHSGGTRRRSRPRNRLRWPGRPPRPRIKAPTATVSFWRVLVSLSPVCLSVCLSVCLCARKPYLCAAASLQAINICPCAALARSPSIRVWCAAVPERRLPPPSSSAEEQHVRPRPSK